VDIGSELSIANTTRSTSCLKVLVTLDRVNRLVVALVWKINPDTDTIDSFGDALVPSLVLLVVNIVMILGVGALLREQGRRDRQRLEAKRAALEPAEAAPASAGR